MANSSRNILKAMQPSLAWFAIWSAATWRKLTHPNQAKGQFRANHFSKHTISRVNHSFGIFPFLFSPEKFSASQGSLAPAAPNWPARSMVFTHLQPARWHLPENVSLQCTQRKLAREVSFIYPRNANV